MANRTVLLATFPSEPAAQIARAVLASNDIPSIVSSDGASGLEPQLNFVQGVRLLVREEDVDEAQALLAEGEDVQIQNE